MSLDIAKLSKLANLPIKENDNLSKDLESITSHFEVLEKINTTNVEPLYQVNGLKNVYREDKIIETPPIKDGFFVTKAVINKNG